MIKGKVINLKLTKWVKLTNKNKQTKKKYIFAFKYMWQIKRVHMLVKKLSQTLISVNSTKTKSFVGE